MLRYSLFQVSDLVGMAVYPRFEGTRETVVDLTASTTGRQQVKGVMEGQSSWTAWDEGHPVAACGILPDGSTWAFMGPQLGRYAKSIARASIKMLKWHNKNNGPVYADINLSDPRAVRWAKLLGFKFEAGAPCAEQPLQDTERWTFHAMV